MKRSMMAGVCFLLMTSLAAGQPFRSTARNKEIGIQFYKNIEFLGAVFFMGSMAAEANQENARMPDGKRKGDWFAYDLSLYKKYQSFVNHPDLLIMAGFGERSEGSILARLLIHLDEFPRAVIRPEKDGPYLRPFLRQGDSAASIKEVVEFVAAANRLYKAMDFEVYFRDHVPFYEKALSEIRSVLPDARLITTMEQYYRQSFARYALIPSLTIPAGMAFGVNYTAAGNTTIMNLFGPFALQQFSDTAALNMGFADSNHIRELSTHEFGHSFSNPAVALIPPALVKETARLFGPVREAMENQGYNTWSACLYEYFVRAGEVVIARKLGRQASAERLLKYYVEGRRFVHLPLVIAELEKYDRDPRITYQQAVINAMEKLKTQP
ncbi:DUF4932 domain-containing protein [Paraflavitalea soli]|nr:DUF4932 domain-containing protein [Paraflavitalea soli]